MTDIKTKSEWLNELCNQLQSINGIKYVGRQLKSPANQEKSSPYIGVVSREEISQAIDSVSERFLTKLALIITTKEQDAPIEDIVEDIKTLLRTAVLADNVHQVSYVDTKVVAIQNTVDADGNKYSKTLMNINVIWSTTYGTATRSEKSLTSPLATAHYKMYALLSSGSYASQPLGVNVYDSQYTAALTIPQGSGSLLVGARYDTPKPQAVYSSSTIDNHLIGLSVDVVTGYVGQNPDLHMTMRLVDDVIYKIRTNWNLGGAYKGPDNTNTLSVPQICAVIPDSNCVGARINLVVNCWKEYEQE